MSAALTSCPILHQDRFLIAVHKPSGLLSHPNAGSPRPQSAAFEGSYHEGTRCFNTPSGQVWLLHRLDQDTSGVLLAALDLTTAQKLRALFEDFQVQKTYLAALRGQAPTQALWEDHLQTRSAGGAQRSSVLKGRPANAQLQLRRLEHHVTQRISLVQIALITGRTHQIRVQAASRQHPLCGDDVYGDFSMNRRLRQDLGLRRLALHAWRLQFKHPASGQPMDLRAPLPLDLESLWQKLGWPSP